MELEQECGCKIVSAFLSGNTIEYCPKHKAASDMYEAIISYLDNQEIGVLGLVGAASKAGRSS